MFRNKVFSNRLPVTVEVIIPALQRSDVVRTDALDCFHFESSTRSVVYRRQELVNCREIASGEDVAVDECVHARSVDIDLLALVSPAICNRVGNKVDWKLTE